MTTTCAIKVWPRKKPSKLETFGGARVGAIDMALAMGKMVRKTIHKTPNKFTNSNDTLTMN